MTEKGISPIVELFMEVGNIITICFEHLIGSWPAPSFSTTC